MKPSVALELHSEEIRRIVEANNGLNPRVFGSSLHGDDAEGSGLDLLTGLGEGLRLMGIARITLAIEDITKVRVDVRTPGGLPDIFRDQVVAEARPLRLPKKI